MHPSTMDPFDVLRARLSGTDPVRGARLALVIEGGGMRGVISAAMAGVLEELGAHHHLDLFVGTSAGATNAVAAAGGVVRRMSDTYVDVFWDRRFADGRRLLRGAPAVDARLVVETSEQLLELHARLPERPTVGVVATRVPDATPEAFTDFPTREHLLAALTASGSLPLVGGPPAAYDGAAWTDGGVTEAVPVATAARLGATHAIVLATRPAGVPVAYGALDRVVELYLRRLGPDLANAYRGRPMRYAEQRAAMEAGSFAGVRTTVLGPAAGDPIPSRTDRDPVRLRAARDAARETALALVAGLGLESSDARLSAG